MTGELPILNGIWQELEREDGGRLSLLSAHLDSRDPAGPVVRIIMTAHTSEKLVKKMIRLLLMMNSTERIHESNATCLTVM